jgi:hypothetical protein
VLIGSIVIAVKYQKPVDIESVCKEASQPLVNDISSCSPIDKTLRSLEVEGYKPLVLESSKQSKGLLREKFYLQIFEVKNYKLNNYTDTGAAQFRFINGRLFAISYFPNTPNTAFKQYPESQSGTITVKHLINYQEKKYILWSDDRLEAYITWWISKFS